MAETTAATTPAAPTATRSTPSGRAEVVAERVRDRGHHQRGVAASWHGHMMPVGCRGDLCPRADCAANWRPRAKMLHCRGRPAPALACAPEPRPGVESRCNAHRRRASGRRYDARMGDDGHRLPAQELSRTTSRVSSSRGSGGSSGCRIVSSSRATISRPICSGDWCTVVSGGCGRLGERGVVEADHRDVVRDAAAGLAQHPQRAGGHQVVGAEDGVEVRAARRAAPASPDSPLSSAEVAVARRASSAARARRPRSPAR